MRVKLITIAILTLLLCATVPIAATAIKEKTTISAKAYNGIYDPAGGGWFTKDKGIGRVVVDTQAGTWSFKHAGNVQFTPGVHYLCIAFDATSPTDAGHIIGHLTADENGRLVSATDQPIDYWSTSQVVSWLNNDEWVFVSNAF